MFHITHRVPKYQINHRHVRRRRCEKRTFSLTKPKLSSYFLMSWTEITTVSSYSFSQCRPWEAVLSHGNGRFHGVQPHSTITRSGTPWSRFDFCLCRHGLAYRWTLRRDFRVPMPRVWPLSGRTTSHYCSSGVAGIHHDERFLDWLTFAAISSQPLWCAGSPTPVSQF